MENFNFITNFISGQNTAKMFIRKPIGGDNGINGESFGREMEFLAANGVEEVIIDINSGGGSIVEGFAIYSAIKDAPLKTTTRVIGLAASMAGIISQAGDKRIILDYALFHSHGPQVPKGKTVEKELLNKMLGSLKTMISAKTDLPEDKVSAMLEGENVLTALEAKQKGFFDEIEVTKGLKPTLAVNNTIETLYEMANNFLTNNNEMSKLSEILKLENATEDQMVSSIEGLQNDLEAKTTELEAKTTDLEAKTTELEAKTTKLEELEAKTTELEANISEMKKAAATSLIENAIKSGQIKEESKTNWIEQATNDLEATKNLLSGISSSAKAVDLNNEIVVDEVVNERKEWDFQKWSQEDPKGLERMKNEDEVKFNELFNAYLEN